MHFEGYFSRPSLRGDPGDDRRVLTLVVGVARVSVSVERQQRAQVGDVHQADGKGLVDHHGGGGEGQAAVD